MRISIRLGRRIWVQRDDPVGATCIETVPVEPDLETAQMDSLQLDRRRRNPNLILLQVAGDLFKLRLEGQQISQQFRRCGQRFDGRTLVQLLDKRRQSSPTRIDRPNQVLVQFLGRPIPTPLLPAD